MGARYPDPVFIFALYICQVDLDCGQWFLDFVHRGLLVESIWGEADNIGRHPGWPLFGVDRRINRLF
jgi:hypothetical protein